MPKAAGPRQSAKENLIFAYDVGDVKNSYAGEPTTNYQVGYGPWTVGGINTDVTGTADQGPIKNALTWKFEKTAGSNQWNGWEATYGGIWTGNSGDVWTTSYWYKTSAAAGITGFGVGSFYLSDWSRPYNTTFLGGSTSIIADGQWRYGWATTQFNENYSNAIIVDGPSWGYSTQAGTLYINGLQWEKKSHPTTFAAYSRSSTQALKPIISNTSLDLSNVSFDANAQMTFDGTNDYIDITDSLGTLSEYTIEHVSYKGSENKMPINARTNTNFYQYGDNSWAYTHGGVWGEYYYPKTKTINGWGHWVITYNGSYVKIYRNGVFEGQQATSGTADWTNGMRIGQHGPYSGYNWNGQIAVVKMYNRALTATEVQQNYKSYKTRFKLS